LHLDTGSAQECVILKLTDKKVTYETELGRATLPRDKVVAITREPEETNQQLMKRWQAARAAEAARARARKREAQVERLRHEAVGEVFYQGEWITPEERSARVEAERRAKETAARVDREEAAARHRFAYGVWWTPQAYEQLHAKETALQAQTAQLAQLQDRVNLKSDQIENLRARMLQEADVDQLDDLAKRIETLRKERTEVGAEIADVRSTGDQMAADIQALIAQARADLIAALEARGEDPTCLPYLKGP